MMKREQSRKDYIVEEMDKLFDMMIVLSHEVRKVEFDVPVFDKKVEEAILKNIEKIGSNILVAHKRASEAAKNETK